MSFHIKEVLRICDQVNAVKAEGRQTHHLRTGNVQQIWGVEAGGEGLGLQGAGILQLLDGGELGLIVARFCDGEAWREPREVQG